MSRSLFDQYGEDIMLTDFVLSASESCQEFVKTTLKAQDTLGGFNWLSSYITGNDIIYLVNYHSHMDFDYIIIFEKGENGKIVVKKELSPGL